MKIRSAQDMIHFWKSLAQKHKILLLHWELGAGKTILAKWFAAWLGIDPNIVQSPTYAYINSYENKLLHIDLYRINKFEELVEKWILDQIQNHEYIVIERPKFISKLGISKHTFISIEKISENLRELKVSKRKKLES